MRGSAPPPLLGPTRVHAHAHTYTYARVNTATTFHDRHRRGGGVRRLTNSTRSTRRTRAHPYVPSPPPSDCNRAEQRLLALATRLAPTPPCTPIHNHNYTSFTTPAFRFTPFTHALRRNVYSGSRRDWDAIDRDVKKAEEAEKPEGEEAQN